MHNVTVRIKIGNYEIEAIGPRKWVEAVLERFIAKIRRSQYSRK
jgi:hypothetical protein